jgi:hypothetical protein
MTAPAINHDHASLAQLDDRIAEQPMGALTLDPSRTSARSLTELVSHLVSHPADPSQSAHLTAAAAAVAEAQLQSFPDNLFWDFDFYLGSIHRHAAGSTDYAGYLQKVSLLTVGLMKLHGQQSTIRFRYVHDFMYGFDWARWVRRDPSARQGVEPFGLSFLRQTEGRGRDILTLVEADDGWYPKLDDGESRNPFPFSRETDEELPLYRLLAKRGDIPVEAWRLDARPDASRDFDVLREGAAASLGLGR